MPNTFTLIQAVTVGSGGASNIDFTSIPSTYTDLCLKFSARSNQSQIYDYAYINFNNTGYSATTRYIQGAGSGTPSSSFESTGYLGIFNGNTSTANTFSNNEIYIPNYAGSTNKSFSVDGTMENNATLSYMHLVAGLWSSTSAINRITIKPSGSNTFLQYSTAYLYGIVNS
jgi:hypothetical protein